MLWHVYRWDAKGRKATALGRVRGKHWPEAIARAWKKAGARTDDDKKSVFVRAKNNPLTTTN